MGYFCSDLDTREGHIVFNRTVGLRESKDAKEIRSDLASAYAAASSSISSS